MLIRFIASNPWVMTYRPVLLSVEADSEDAACDVSAPVGPIATSPAGAAENDSVGGARGRAYCRSSFDASQ